MSETHKQVLQAANSAISKGHYEEFLEHCAEDTQWHFIGDRTLSGKDMVRQWGEISYDEGKTWAQSFDLYYYRKKR